VSFFGVKGASILRMIRSFLSDTDFNLGVGTFLKKNKFGSVLTDDLWQALSSVSKIYLIGIQNSEVKNVQNVHNVRIVKI
jgi:aminopeptidase N